MKYLITAIILALHFNAVADTMKVITRDSSMNLVPEDVQLDELGLDDTFEQFKYFNILKGDTDDALPMSELAEKEKLRVLTLGFHLTKARNYFTKLLKADHIEKLGKITVRYEMSRSFNTGKHFETTESKHNNVETYKASNQYALDGVKKWGNEIWFRPAADKTINVPKGNVSSTEISNELLSLADAAIIDVTKEASLGYAIGTISYDHYLSQIGLLIVLKIITPNALDFIYSAIPFKMNLDSAMIPEIIYHEFTHIALSDHVHLTGSFPVSEGIANYFASVISGNTQIADKLGDYGKNIQPIKINSRLKYNSHFEVNSNLAHHPFTYNYLWAMRDRVSREIKNGNEDSAIIFDQIVFESRKYIDFASDLTISKSLPDALIKATTTVGLDRYTAKNIRLIVSQTAKNIGM